MTVNSLLELFTVNLVTQVIGILFVIFWLPDVKARTDHKKSDNENGDARSKTEMSLDDSSSKKCPETVPAHTKRNFCMDFFDPTHIKEAFNVLRVARPNNKRKILLFVVLLNAIVYATIGEDELYILYGRKALNWTTEFSIFVSYYTVIGIMGTGIAIIIFSKALQMSDPTLAMISIAGSFVANPILVSPVSFVTFIRHFKSISIVGLRSFDPNGIYWCDC